LDDEHAEWLQIGLQLLRRDLAAATHVLQALLSRGFRDNLGDVVGGLGDVWAMPERSFRDLVTWRAEVDRLRDLVEAKAKRDS
jgi:hypothetical protein